MFVGVLFPARSDICPNPGGICWRAHRKTDTRARLGLEADVYDMYLFWGPRTRLSVEQSVTNKTDKLRMRPWDLSEMVAQKCLNPSRCVWCCFFGCMRVAANRHTFRVSASVLFSALDVLGSFCFWPHASKLINYSYYIAEHVSCYCIGLYRLLLISSSTSNLTSHAIASRVFGHPDVGVSPLSVSSLAKR